MPSLHEVTKKFRETVKQWDLWKKDASLGLAVSGGIDSMVLLDLVRRSGTRANQITVLHFNHKLRSEESDQDALFVKKVCQEWKIPFVLGEASLWKRKGNIQDRARGLRYEFFQKEAKKAGIQRLATAHQADDQAETFLIRWIQGAGLKGLAGIPLKGPLPCSPLPSRERVSTEGGEVRGGIQIVRPLFFVTRDEIVDYAKKFEVPFREDSSNQENKYLRNKVRRILSELRELNPNLAVRSAVNAVLLRADEEFLTSPSVSLSLLRRGRVERERSISEYLTFPPSLRYRLLQAMYEEVSGHPLSGEFILKIDSLIQDSKPKSRLDLPHGVRFEKDYVRFLFLPETSSEPFR